MEERDGWLYQGIITEQVSYEDHEARIRPELFEGMAGAFLRTILPIRKNELRELLGTKSVDDFGKPYLSVAPFLKHRGFKEEAEYRIVALCNRSTKRDEGDNRKVKEYYFRSRSGGNVVPYISLYEGLKKILPIKSIIVGPHAQQENQRHAVELVLEQHGITAAVRVSQLPFRE